MPRSIPKETGGQTITMGITDLMTSLAVIFILLLTAYINDFYDVHSQAAEIKKNVKEELREHFKQFNLILEDDPKDPLVLLVVVPEDLLKFEIGKAELRPEAEIFLKEAMPNFAHALCGSLIQKIDSVIIEGHTDYTGTDEYNLKLSQERSFSVMSRALKEIKELPKTHFDNKCFQEMTAASGRGEQDPILDPRYGIPDPQKSRRVIFKIRIKSAEQRGTTQAVRSSLKS